MTKVHYDKFLSGVIYCGRQDYDSATDKKKDVTCKDCLRIMATMKGINWKQVIRREIAVAFGDKVSLVFDDKNNPSLVFKYDDLTKNFKQQVIRYVEDLYDYYGGQVKFFLKQESKL